MADSPPPAVPPGCPNQGQGGLLPDELRAWMRLLAAAGAIEQQLRTHVKSALGVSHDEFLVLCLLADQPGAGLRMTRIAELLGRPKTRLTYQVACLQHAGLVTREAVCGDRRGVEVTLTAKARTLLSEASASLADIVTEAIARTMGPQEHAALRGLLRTTPDTAAQRAGTPDAATQPVSTPESATQPVGTPESATQRAGTLDTPTQPAGPPDAAG
ncbi:MarR family transcriptional regulator [Streptomyces sp. NPDC058274]|uniref:MarR family winged helix-turn-helix transcriptional regulator n=1 Tax=Streptomyces sp. NPDC058274 TaxID=3346416 RepID=UPI0036EC6A2F